MKKKEFYVALFTMLFFIAGVVSYQFMIGEIEGNYYQTNDLYLDDLTYGTLPELNMEIMPPGVELPGSIKIKEKTEQFSPVDLLYSVEEEELPDDADIKQESEENHREYKIVEEPEDENIGSDSTQTGALFYFKTTDAAFQQQLKHHADVEDAVLTLSTKRGTNNNKIQPIVETTVDQAEFIRRNVIINQLSSGNETVVTGMDRQNFAEIEHSFSEGNKTFLVQEKAGNYAFIQQQGYKNTIGDTRFYLASGIKPSEQRSLSVLHARQTGEYNRAEIVQETSDAVVIQEGNDNDIQMDQYNSRSEIHQEGLDNTITLYQNDSSASIYQEGSGNQVFLSQL